MNLKSFVDDARYKLGLVSKEELWRELQPEKEAYAKSLPVWLEDEFRETCAYAEDLRNLKEPDQIYKRMGLLHEKAKMFQAVMRPHEQLDQQATDDREKVANLISGEQFANYAPAGSRMWKFFLNPMGVFTFVGENHWATRAALNILETEIREEGLKYFYADSTSPERLAEVDKRLKGLDLEEYFVNTCLQILTYENSWTLIERNLFGEPVKLKNLRADRIWPKYTYNGEILEGWEYQVGSGVIPYDLDELLHFKGFSLKSPYIGTPRLAPLITEIEADLAASALQNTIMNKAGMVGVIIAMSDPALKNPLRAVNMERQSERLQSRLNHVSGVRGAHSIVVANYIEGVHKLTAIGDLDANFLKLRTEVAKCVCLLLGVPPERLSIPRTGSQQYQAAAVENIIQSAFDKNINALTSRICAFINQKILKEELGIYDVEIKPKGRFSANTINGARMALMASQTGPLFDVNEMRTLFYRVPELPPGDKRGRIVVDNTKNRDEGVLPNMIAQEDPRELISVAPTLQEESDKSYTAEDGDE